MFELVEPLDPRCRTGLSHTRGLYCSWQNMKQRCLNPNHPKYPRYGGRGIRICQEWHDIIGFRDWAMRSGYETGRTIDRIDNDGDYCPANCRWVTAAENSRRKRTTRLTREQAELIRQRLDAGEGERALALEYGVVHGTIWFIRRGVTHVPDGECTKALKRTRRRKS